jgi:hypothetical protein
MDFRERKAARTAYYQEYVLGNKDKVCTACAGSGYYDSLDRRGRSTKCGACNGTGREKSTHMPPKEQFIQDWYKNPRLNSRLNRRAEVGTGSQAVASFKNAVLTLEKETRYVLETFSKVPTSKILKWAGWQETDMNFQILGCHCFVTDDPKVSEIGLSVVNDWGEKFSLTIPITDDTCEELYDYIKAVKYGKNKHP